VATEISANVALHQRPCASSRELVFISLYLTLGSVILMKTAILHAEDIAFTPWGIAVVKAVMRAKFMLLGNAMKLSERATARPLIWPTLENAFALLVLLTIVTATRRRPVPPLVDRCLARTLWSLAPGNDRGLYHHAAGAHSVFRLHGPQPGERHGDGFKARQVGITARLGESLASRNSGSGG
jgi:hypothetical protein